MCFGSSLLLSSHSPFSFSLPRRNANAGYSSINYCTTQQRRMSDGTIRHSRLGDPFGTRKLTNESDVCSADHSKQRGLLGRWRYATCPNRNNTTKMHHVIPFALLLTDGDGGYHRTCHVLGVFGRHTRASKGLLAYSTRYTFTTSKIGFGDKQNVKSSSNEVPQKQVTRNPLSQHASYRRNPAPPPPNKNSILQRD